MIVLFLKTKTRRCKSVRINLFAGECPQDLSEYEDNVEKFELQLVREARKVRKVKRRTIKVRRLQRVRAGYISLTCLEAQRAINRFLARVMAQMHHTTSFWEMMSFLAGIFLLARTARTTIREDWLKNGSFMHLRTRCSRGRGLYSLHGTRECAVLLRWKSTKSVMRLCAWQTDKKFRCKSKAPNGQLDVLASASTGSQKNASSGFRWWCISTGIQIRLPSCAKHSRQ